jgi:hypothetical protein
MKAVLPREDPRCVVMPKVLTNGIFDQYEGELAFHFHMVMTPKLFVIQDEKETFLAAFVFNLSGGGSVNYSLWNQRVAVPCSTRS